MSENWATYCFSGSLHVRMNLRELPELMLLLQQAGRPSLRNYLAATFRCLHHASGQHYHPRHVRHVPHYPLSALHYRSWRRTKLDTGGSEKLFAIYQRHCRYGSISSQAPWDNARTFILATYPVCRRNHAHPSNSWSSKCHSRRKNMGFGISHIHSRSPTEILLYLAGCSVDRSIAENFARGMFAYG